MKSKKQTKFYIKERRIFSEAIRQETVKNIESGRCTVKQAADELLVSSTAIYKWVYRYSRYQTKKTNMVIEDSAEAFRSKELEKKVKELEAIVGRKQMEIDVLNKIIDLANQEFKTDLKKNSSPNAFSGSKTIKK
jgi:transposase